MRHIDGVTHLQSGLEGKAYCTNVQIRRFLN